MRVLVVGAGIGGLALCANLRKLGIEPVVIDKAHQWKSAGYVIGLWSNGMRMLERMGLADKVRERSVLIPGQEAYDDQGRLLARISYDGMWRRHGTGHAINRSYLHEILREANPGLDVRLSTTLTSLENRKDFVEVTLSDGTRESFDLVVGADGINSCVRSFIFPHVAPRYMGVTSWVIWMPKLPEAPKMVVNMVANGKAFGIYPVKGEERACGYFFMSAPPNAQDPLEQRIIALKEHFAELARVMPSVLECLPDRPDEIFHHDHEQIDAGNWHKGRVALMGDAAHALSPLLGMGASMALEDAHVLADEIGKAHDVEAALRAYAARRQPRIARAQKVSNAFDGLVRLRLPVPLYKAKNLLVSLCMERYYLRKMESVIGAQV